MTTKVEPTVEKWEERVVELLKSYIWTAAGRPVNLDRFDYTKMIKLFRTILSHSVQEAKAGEAKKTAMDIIHLLDDLEVKQPEDLKTDNWRNWKYIRNSIVDKYGILTQLRTESTLNTKEEV